ncbi:MAG: response regulator transcription factor, partial [Chloroflexi bacterium]|nr:response regulator transcription factor [Chloroflexota bacterium]
MKLRVLTVDDHPVFRDGLRATLSVDPELELVGEVGTASEAVELTLQLHPQLIVMDVQLPDMSGIEA